MQLRVRALESILLEKGYIEPAAIDELIETYEKRIGPRNGAHVVAKAWVDPAFPPMAACRRHDRRDNVLHHLRLDRRRLRPGRLP